MANITHGFICINKPAGPSSFTAMQRVRRALGVSKAGHAGTLDPAASGLLVVALGDCTRLLDYLELEPKVYEFSVIFGRTTDTLDGDGAVVAESDVVPSENLLADVIAKFTGMIEQIPPKYSAIKIDGARAYDLARKGADVEMKPRAVNIYSIDMCGYDGGQKRADFAVSCSSGTYVRSLARDIAAAAGSVGFAGRIHRTRTGRFDLSMAADYQSIITPGFPPGNAMKYIISTGDVFDESVKTVITGQQKTDISHGREIVVSGNKLRDVMIAFDEEGALAAVLKRVDGDRYHPDKVFKSNGYAELPVISPNCRVKSNKSSQIISQIRSMSMPS